jgi:ArsR family transcriptional regulator, arsenate/arsenite/antimonite-responsive transcriptional repressor
VAPRKKNENRIALSAREIRAITRVLSDPRRYQILKRIAAQQCAACSDLRTTFPISAATLSHHVKELESSGLIETTRRGKFLDVEFQRDTWDAYLKELNKL